MLAKEKPPTGASRRRSNSIVVPILPMTGRLISIFVFALEIKRPVTLAGHIRELPISL